MLSASHGASTAAGPRHLATGRVHFHDVDPESHALEAAALLRRSWTPPCVAYSDSYVRWLLSVPGTTRPRAVLARDGAPSRAIGFAALVPRQLATTEGVTPVYVLTFFAVDPDYRGARVGSALARRLVGMSDRPIVTYTEPGSRSARALTQAAIDRGWIGKPVATLRTYVGARESDQAPVVARPATAEEFVAALGTPDSPAIAWSQPTLEQARHYLADPRGACFAVAEGRSGDRLGAALIVRADVVTAAGADRVPSLEAVHLTGQHAAALRAFRAFALEIDRASLVTAPNLGVVPADAIRAAGFRATRSTFNATILGSPRDAFVQRGYASNLEVF